MLDFQTDFMERHTNDALVQESFTRPLFDEFEFVGVALFQSEERNYALSGAGSKPEGVSQESGVASVLVERKGLHNSRVLTCKQVSAVGAADQHIVFSPNVVGIVDFAVHLLGAGKPLDRVESLESGVLH